MKTLKSVKRLKLTLGSLALLLAGCASPQPIELNKACAQPPGARVIVRGYLSLPDVIDTVQLRQGGRITEVGYQIPLMRSPSAPAISGEAVKTTIWATDRSKPNRIRPFPVGPEENDLLVYSDDRREIGPGTAVKITGMTVPDEKSGCVFNAAKIEIP